MQQNNPPDNPQSNKVKRRRNFNALERYALFVHANGKCQKCGIELDDTWEADHIIPFSKGGQTTLINGQALCRDCNRKKGNKDMSKIKLRPFQQKFVDVMLKKAIDGKRVLVAHAAAGSGKTLGSQAAADALLERGYIEQVIILVPRLNLAQQYELDWQEMKPMLDWEATLTKVLHRQNSFNRLLPNGVDGYVTTYQSLCANPQKHILQAENKKTLLILDEAQLLGFDEFGRDTGQSARWVTELAKHADYIIVMSGTPYRADNKPLLFATYGKAGEDGVKPLLADLEATYRDGVRERYLRRFEYHLANGGYTWNSVTGETDDYIISDKESSVYHALQLPEVYNPMIEHFVDRLELQKEVVNNRFAGLIACMSQSQARDVKKYIKNNHPHLRVLIAISDDGEAAHKSLRDFKTGKYDILVTVSMAYVGYDYKWINTVLLLTAIRSKGYLMQLVARGLRVISSVEYDKQPCYIIAPDDPKMTEFVEFMREESDAGYKQQGLPDDGPGKRKKKGHELGYATNGFLDDLRALGIDPNSDLNTQEFMIATQVQRANNLPHSVTDMMGIYRAMHARLDKKQSESAQPARPQKTNAEQIAELRSKINKIVGSLAYQLDPSEIGKMKSLIFSSLNRVYGNKSITKVDDMEELRARWSTAQRWLEKGAVDGRQ